MSVSPAATLTHRHLAASREHFASSTTHALSTQRPSVSISSAATLTHWYLPASREHIASSTTPALPTQNPSLSISPAATLMLVNYKFSVSVMLATALMPAIYHHILYGGVFGLKCCLTLPASAVWQRFEAEMLLHPSLGCRMAAFWCLNAA